MIVKLMRRGRSLGKPVLEREIERILFSLEKEKGSGKLLAE